MNSKTLYALDFDGVICNSAVETALTGWQAAQSLWPDLEKLFLSDDLIQQFINIRPCLEFGYEALLIVRLLHQGVSLDVSCQNYHEEIQALIDENEFNIDALKILFGRTRDAQIQNNEASWLASNPLFSGVADKLKTLDENDWLIVTTKQERFVEAILNANGIMLESTCIFGLDRKLNKQTVLENLITENPTRPITFVEDRLPTLLGVQENPKLSAIKLQLVDWGYNTLNERKMAQQNDIELIALDDFLDN